MRRLPSFLTLVGFSIFVFSSWVYSSENVRMPQGAVKLSGSPKEVKLSYIEWRRGGNRFRDVIKGDFSIRGGFGKGGRAGIEASENRWRDIDFLVNGRENFTERFKRILRSVGSGVTFESGQGNASSVWKSWEGQNRYMEVNSDGSWKGGHWKTGGGSDGGGGGGSSGGNAWETPDGRKVIDSEGNLYGPDGGKIGSCDDLGVDPKKPKDVSDAMGAAGWDRETTRETTDEDPEDPEEEDDDDEGDSQKSGEQFCDPRECGGGGGSGEIEKQWMRGWNSLNAYRKSSNLTLSQERYLLVDLYMGAEGRLRATSVTGVASAVGAVQGRTTPSRAGTTTSQSAIRRNTAIQNQPAADMPFRIIPVSH